MDLFKKKEPLIVADLSADTLPPPPPGIPAGSTLTGAGGLTRMVEQTLALEMENNKMLKHIQTMDSIAFWVKLLVWALVLGLPVIFFQPMINYIQKAVTENPALIGIPSSADFYRAVDEFSTKHPVQ